jgi:hypothetical protein
MSGLCRLATADATINHVARTTYDDLGSRSPNGSRIDLGQRNRNSRSLPELEDQNRLNDHGGVVRPRSLRLAFEWGPDGAGRPGISLSARVITLALVSAAGARTEAMAARRSIASRRYGHTGVD